MKIYYIEYENTIKFFNNENTLEIGKGKILEEFLKSIYHKFGKKIKLKSLI